MKKKLLLLFFFTCCLSPLWAQIQVKGKVTAEGNDPLPGVSILIEGSTSGTTTDATGNYSLQAPANGTLVFTFIGYSPKKVPVNNRSILNVSLVSDSKQLGEVVVTALGIQRDKKALQYAVTEVKGSNFTEARENNLGNALVGRVAGVNVSKVNSGPAGSSRVIIRGNKSLNGNNQPLYVVDGIPMDNSNFGQAGVWGGRDGGDGMSSINPDDIESISVLKGASAAALYGSRAGNGVILITTKKGSTKKGLGIEFNSNYVFERINNQLDLQKEYGSGVYRNGVAVKPSNQQEAYQMGDVAWGPKFDGSQVVQFDGVARPYAYAGDNFKRYFQSATNLTNTIALTGGNDKQSFRFAYSDLRGQGVVPNSGFDRKNLSLNTNGKFGEKLTFNAKALYSNEMVQNRPRLSDSPGNGIQAIMRMPPNYNVMDYYGDPNKPGAIPAGTSPASLSIFQKAVGEEYQQAPNNWGQNPWWTAYQFRENDVRDRLITSGSLRYDLTSFLYVQTRYGMDWYTRRNTSLTPQGTGYNRAGSMEEGEDRVRETNIEWMLGVDKSFLEKFNFNAFAGGNRMRRTSERIVANGNGFNVPFFAAINNTVQRNFGYGYSGMGINSLFGSAEISYDGFLFLTATARNDWFSVLNPKTNNILYPSIGGSFVFSEAATMPGWLSFGKVRASWAQVGTANVGPYETILSYTLRGDHNGSPWATFSSAGSNNGTIPNLNIKPATSTEREVGVDLRFLGNRLGIDLTYYHQKTTDDILRATISRGSGFGSTLVNVGEMENKGIELLLTGTPLKQAVTWDMSLNLARNRNKVNSLSPGVSEMIIEEPRTRTVFVKHMIGQPFGVITGFVQKKDAKGNLMYDRDSGMPLQSDKMEIIGNGVADLTGGFNNSITYKGFNLSGLIDFRYGGDVYSGTNVRLTQWGLHKQTLLGREGELKIKGVDQNGDALEKTLTPQQAQQYWNQMGNRAQDRFIYDGSFLKLRQLTVGYNIPRSLLEKTPIGSLTLSLVSRNLAILYKNTENIDPEAAYSNSNGQGLDYFGMPATRSYGFNLRATF